MNDEDEDVPCIELLLDEGMLRILLESVTERLERWPGGDPEEQEFMLRLKVILFAASLEFQMNKE